MASEQASAASRKRAGDGALENHSPKKLKGEVSEVSEVMWVPLHERFGTEMVDIYIGAGAEETHFRVHKQLLCSKIPYFEAMFGSGFSEGLSSSAILSEDDPESFGVLYEWIYLDTVTLPQFCIETIPGGLDVSISRFSSLLKLLDKICLPKVIDAAVTHFLDFCKEYSVLPISPHVTPACQGLPEHLRFRKFYARGIHYILSGRHRARCRIKWPTEGIHQLLQANPDLNRDLLEILSACPAGEVAKRPWEISYCEYHQHGPEEECSAKSKM
ncbi:hypothetical protein LZ554_008258 [Drepanopeziza brunnea f. sp. 'monogermtubi']|nr:hypothetical protein LZ554_008258 [Drepanopeziza brunnea f. sp. 'monogermtubi']